LSNHAVKARATAVFCQFLAGKFSFFGKFWNVAALCAAKTWCISEIFRVPLTPRFRERVGDRASVRNFSPQLAVLEFVSADAESGRLLPNGDNVPC
jgi:hypothetical protein